MQQDRCTHGWADLGGSNSRPCGCLTEHEAALSAAFERGREAAENAASWAADGNTSPEHVRRVLAMIEAGDPAADDYLPSRPNLSGEWADAPTPQSLAADILGADYETHGYNAPDFLPADAVEAIADAFEAGVSDAFLPACEAALRGWLS